MFFWLAKMCVPASSSTRNVRVSIQIGPRRILRPMRRQSSRSWPAITSRPRHSSFRACRHSSSDDFVCPVSSAPRILRGRSLMPAWRRSQNGLPNGLRVSIAARAGCTKPALAPVKHRNRCGRMSYGWTQLLRRLLAQVGERIEFHELLLGHGLLEKFIRDGIRHDAVHLREPFQLHRRARM